MAKKALIVGINAYDPPNVLPSCVADADAFERLLTNKFGFTDVVNLRDRQASNAAMSSALQTLLNGASSGDDLVFYYSGHGYSLEKGDALVEALVPQDAQFFDSDELGQLTASVPPGALTVVLDACFSGGMEKAFVLASGSVERAKVKRYQPSGADKGFVVLSPGKPLEYRAFGHVAGQTPAAAVQNFQAGQPSAKAFSILVPPPVGDSRRFLLVSACLADETAAASTSQTAGQSAFTFSFLNRIALPQLAAGATSTLLDAAGQHLRELGITQTPMLKAPLQLDQRPFLQWRSSSTDAQAPSSKPFSTPHTERNITTMASTVSPAADKGFLDIATQLASAVAPLAINYLKNSTSKGFVGPDAVTVDSKGFASIMQGVLHAALPIIAQSMATTQKGFVPSQSVEDKGFLDSLSAAASSVVSSPFQIAVQAALAA